MDPKRTTDPPAPRDRRQGRPGAAAGKGGALGGAVALADAMEGYAGGGRAGWGGAGFKGLDENLRLLSILERR